MTPCRLLYRETLARVPGLVLSYLPLENSSKGHLVRCPMECRLQYAQNWSCQVVLRFQYDAHGKARTEMKEVPFGGIIYDKNEVTTRLERAQHAILNPNIAPESILKGDVQSNSDTLTFSANCVCVRVAGPNVPDLYFYDLPGEHKLSNSVYVYIHRLLLGVIANVSDGGKERDIELVDKLATSYVSRPNCLVLLVITCDSEDFIRHPSFVLTGVRYALQLISKTRKLDAWF